MSIIKVSLVAALSCCLALGTAARAADEDWVQKSIEVADGGLLVFEFPEYWGKKPKLDSVEGIRTVRFGPYGTRKKPIFLVHLEAITAAESVPGEAVREVTDNEAASLKNIAVETDVLINDIAGPNVAGHYFSITDRSSKTGEYDYLTLAILGAGHLLVKCYFFSSDGAPDFGADALQMMQSITYVPPPEPEAKKKR